MASQGSSDIPYTKSYTKIQDIDPFFEYDSEKKTMRFIGETLEVRVPKRFEVYGLLQVHNNVETVGIMDLIIDETYQAGLHLLAKIVTYPTNIWVTTIQNIEYMVFSYTTGDLFIENTEVVKDSNIIYAVYVEFMTRGNMMYTFTYNDIARLFDSSKIVTGSSIPVDHSILEMVYSHLSRDQDNKFDQYRHTDMSEPFSFIALRSVGYAPDSTTSRMLGSYFDEGVNANLVHENDTRHPVEDLLRGHIPDEDGNIP